MSEFIKTFEKKNKRTPIWLMRQAGRYMPEYMEIRSKLPNFLDLCYNSDKASEVTMQPVNRFGTDAAILFSDILVLPHALGWGVDFKKNEGPVLEQFKNSDDLKKLSTKLDSKVENIYQTVSKVKSKLNKDTSLIGFAGSPWTVMSYMLEGKGKQDFSVSKNILYTQKDASLNLLDIITHQTVNYLEGQIQAGADAIQLFDSWSGVLSEHLYEDFVIKPTIKITKLIKEKYPDLPIIGFPRGSGYKYDDYISKSGIDGVGVDQFTNIDQMKKWQKNIVVQGNLDPVILLGSKEMIKNEVNRIMKNMENNNFIFNLGHGIIKTTPVENVEFLVDYVKNYKR